MTAQLVNSSGNSYQQFTVHSSRIMKGLIVTFYITTVCDQCILVMHSGKKIKQQRPQSSTAISNQSSDKLVSTQINIIGMYYSKENNNTQLIAKLYTQLSD